MGKKIHWKCLFGAGLKAGGIALAIIAVISGGIYALIRWPDIITGSLLVIIALAIVISFICGMVSLGIEFYSDCKSSAAKPPHKQSYRTK